LSNSILFQLSKKNKFLRKIYFFYNIYIRNKKFLKNSSQFGEDKFILDLFDKDYRGKYLDLGCYHPTRHSNTNILYQNGWTGINIDLNPLTIELFNFMRPKDFNYNVGISNSEGEKELYFINEFNTQNTLDKNQLNFLKNHHNVKDREISKIKLKTKKLETILLDSNFYNIDFFNIDIEGHELEVIESIDFDKFKFKYICVEMIQHNETSVSRSKKIKDILNNNDFIIVKKFEFNYIYKNTLLVK
jgi:FkbM family methyltransferase